MEVIVEIMVLDDIFGIIFIFCEFCRGISILWVFISVVLEFRNGDY